MSDIQNSLIALNDDDNLRDLTCAFFSDALDLPLQGGSPAPLDFKGSVAAAVGYKDTTHAIVDSMYLAGFVGDTAFETVEGSVDLEEARKRFHGIWLLAVDLKERDGGLPPTRTQLADITRAATRGMSREASAGNLSDDAPVVCLFRYLKDGRKHAALVASERVAYAQSQQWRGGERAGRVSILRDIDLAEPHAGHIRILNDLRLSSARPMPTTFEAIAAHWQSVFDTGILSKKFYKELSDWYFWACRHVSFPGAPAKAKEETKAKYEEKLRTHTATAMIRMVTRLLFTWFLKEKGLVAEQLFDNESAGGVLKEGAGDSQYYKAILQNLFFATLNQEMGDRRFRTCSGSDYGVPTRYRYEAYFANPKGFMDLQKCTPFLNCGLFECQDKPHPTQKNRNGNPEMVRLDGFSDHKKNPLEVPDVVFWGDEEEVDLKKEYGSKTPKRCRVRGLIPILQSYKFTIAENTPLEQDIALDPELLGQVFENLLASYNPETQTTARKQTGSFYTPREIVDYMVTESLVAYLSGKLTNDGEQDEALEKDFRTLLADGDEQPFDEAKDRRAIVSALAEIKILDPACGSGAFPMGALHRMVNALKKLDPDNTLWRVVQERIAGEEAEAAIKIGDKDARDHALQEISDSFERHCVDPDYARKLYLIERCIYGVDIQPIATQISRLRFFISLMVDQNADSAADNMGVKALPNLETKFVAANTLIGLSVADQLGGTVKGVKELTAQLSDIRHRHFNAKTWKTKKTCREEDKKTRELLAVELRESGMPSDAAGQMAEWDPYDQNSYAGFFDLGWMFGLDVSMDLIIGNPPYSRPRTAEGHVTDYYRCNYAVAHNQLDLYHLFMEYALKHIKDSGVATYIVSNSFLANENTEKLRRYILKNGQLDKIVDLKEQVFEGASVDTVICLMTSHRVRGARAAYVTVQDGVFETQHALCPALFESNPRCNYTVALDPGLQAVFAIVANTDSTVDTYFNVTTGIKEYQVGKGDPPQQQADKEGRVFNADRRVDASFVPEIRGRNVGPFTVTWNGEHIKYGPWLAEPRSRHFFEGRKILIRKIPSRDRQVLAVQKGFMIADQSLYIGKIRAKCSCDEYYAVGVLSSQLIHWFFRVMNNETDDLFPQIKTKQFKQLPLRWDPRFAPAIRALSKSLHCEALPPLLCVLDALVFELYLCDHMKERDLAILDLVNQDIGRFKSDFSQADHPAMPSSDTIHKLSEMWSQSSSQVRKKIEEYPTRSPDVLARIVGS